MTDDPSTSVPRFGVNYTPSVGWFHHWLDFDLDAVRADLDSIAALSLDHIRVFPLWPLFQPNRSLIRPTAIEQLVALADAAAERGLDVSVDGLQGHLSSFDFQPAWVTSWHRRNMFTDPDALDGEAEYLRALASALADRPNFLGMTLGNETNQFSDNPHPNPDRLTSAQATAWLERMLAACEAGAPGKFHLHCLNDFAWYQDGHAFTPAHAARLGAATAIHSWVFNGAAQRYGRESAAVGHHAEYMIELSKAWAVHPRRPVWLQEVGAPAPLIPPGAAAEFARTTVANVLDCPDVWGVTWWCSHDVDRRLADFPELEYSLGLLTNARKPKPAGLELAKLINEVRMTGYRPAVRSTALVVDLPEDVNERAICAPGGMFFEAYMRLVADGVRPTVVLSAHTNDLNHLTARGITEVLTVHDVRSYHHA